MEVKGKHEENPEATTQVLAKRDALGPPDLCFLGPLDPRDSNYARFYPAHALIYPIHQVANLISG